MCWNFKHYFYDKNLSINKIEPTVIYDNDIDMINVKLIKVISIK